MNIRTSQNGFHDKEGGGGERRKEKETTQQDATVSSHPKKHCQWSEVSKLGAMKALRKI